MVIFIMLAHPTHEQLMFFQLFRSSFNCVESVLQLCLYNSCVCLGRQILKYFILSRVFLNGISLSNSCLGDVYKRQILARPTHEQSIFFQLFRSCFNCEESVLQLCSYNSYICLGRQIPKNFILSKIILNDIFPSNSCCWFLLEII